MRSTRCVLGGTMGKPSLQPRSRASALTASKSSSHSTAAPGALSNSPMAPLIASSGLRSGDREIGRAGEGKTLRSRAPALRGSVALPLSRAPALPGFLDKFDHLRDRVAGAALDLLEREA